MHNWLLKRIPEQHTDTRDKCELHISAIDGATWPSSGVEHWFFPGGFFFSRTPLQASGFRESARGVHWGLGDFAGRIGCFFRLMEGACAWEKFVEKGFENEIFFFRLPAQQVCASVNLRCVNRRNVDIPREDTKTAMIDPLRDPDGDDVFSIPVAREVVETLTGNMSAQN